VKAVGVSGPPTGLYLHVAAVLPAKIRQRLYKRDLSRLSFLVIRGQVHEHANAPHARWLLNPGVFRPRHCSCTCKEREEVATCHSIASSLTHAHWRLLRTATAPLESAHAIALPCDSSPQLRDGPGFGWTARRLLRAGEDNRLHASASARVERLTRIL
jgi:hypothetical protein